jgi:hypothetical protein
MKGTKSALIILAVLLAGGVGQASHPLFFPLSEHTMAKAVGIYSEPLGRTYIFSTQDMQAVSWMNIWRDTRVHTVEWRWYYPEGRVYARSFSVIPPMDSFWGNPAAPVWGCLKIKGHDVAQMPGTWKVDVIVDFRKILTEYFTIRAQAC